MAETVVTPVDRPFQDGPSATQHWTVDHFEALIKYGVGFKMSDIKMNPEFPPYIKSYGRWYAVNNIPMAPVDIENLVNEVSGSGGTSARVKGGNDTDFAYEVQATRLTKHRFRCNASGCLMSGGQTGISFTLRAIPEFVPSIVDAGLVDADGKSPNYILRNMFLPHQGIVLFTGPTGSGKTTTLAAGIGYLLASHPELSVETYEDPIEFDYRTAGGKGPLVQMSVSEHLGGDFSRIARNAARRSSDVVILGECRDRESFRGLIQLADMGMLTFSTLHTRSVAEIPTRILNTFPADEQPEMKTSLVHGLRMGVQQRLLPTVNKKRVVVREYLVFTEPIRYNLSKQKIEEMIPYLREQTKKHGRPLMEDVYALHRQGIISTSVYKRMEAEHEEAEQITG